MNQNPTSADMITSSADKIQEKMNGQANNLAETCQSPRNLPMDMKKAHTTNQKFEMKCFTSPRRNQSAEGDDQGVFLDDEDNVVRGLDDGKTG